MRRAKTTTIEQALRILSRDIVSGDGVADAALIEAAERLAEMRGLLQAALPAGWMTMPKKLAADIKKAIT